MTRVSDVACFGVPGLRASIGVAEVSGCGHFGGCGLQDLGRPYTSLNSDALSHLALIPQPTKCSIDGRCPGDRRKTPARGEAVLCPDSVGA